MSLRFLATPTLLLALAFMVWVAPVAAGDDLSDEELVERILELQREIDDLMARLPPRLRDEVRRRLAAPAIKEPRAAEPRAAEAETERAAAAEPEPAKPVEIVETAPPPPPQRRLRRSRPACNTLEIFDTNGDGTVNAMDRYWRYLYLWLDRNRNGTLEDREIVSTYKEKVREIAPDLDAFATAKSGFGAIRVAERVVLDLRGNGFDGAGARDDAVLAVDATALQRGDGPVLLSAAGEEIEGVRPFERGWRVRQSDGEVIRLTCP